MTIDIELPIEKSTCKTIHEFEEGIFKNLLIFIICILMPISIGVIGDLFYIILFLQISSKITPNVGGAIGFVFGICIVIFWMLPDLGIVKFHCKGEPE